MLRKSRWGANVLRKSRWGTNVLLFIPAIHSSVSPVARWLANTRGRNTMVKAAYWETNFAALNVPGPSLPLPRRPIEHAPSQIRFVSEYSVFFQVRASGLLAMSFACGDLRCGPAHRVRYAIEQCRRSHHRVRTSRLVCAASRDRRGVTSPACDCRRDPASADGSLYSRPMEWR